KRLEFCEEGVAQIEQHSSADTAHALSLKVTGEEPAYIHAEENQRRQDHTLKIAVPNVHIDGVSDDHRTEKSRSRRDDDGNQRLDGDAVFALHDGKQTPNPRHDADLRGLMRRATECVGVRNCLCCAASHKSGRTPATFPSIVYAFPTPGLLPPSGR